MTLESESGPKQSRLELKARLRFLRPRVETFFESTRHRSSSTFPNGKTADVRSRVSSSSIGSEFRPRRSLIWKTILRRGFWWTTTSNRFQSAQKISEARHLPGPTFSRFSIWCPRPDTRWGWRLTTRPDRLFTNTTLQL